MNSSASESKKKKRLSHSKLKQAFLIDSDADLFMYFEFNVLGSAHEKYGVRNGPLSFFVCYSVDLTEVYITFKYLL